jgi:hypothetical protein
VKARRDIGGKAFRLFQGKREIGFIRDGTVGFVGFTNADDAAFAGQVAHRTLASRRDPKRPWLPLLPHHVLVPEGDRQYLVVPSGILATLRPPQSGIPEDEGWGVEFELLAEEQADVFAVARARAMWTALLGSGAAGRMRQFIPHRQAPDPHQASGRTECAPQ